jgi:hypothetical protein
MNSSSEIGADAEDGKKHGQPEKDGTATEVSPAVILLPEDGTKRNDGYSSQPEVKASIGNFWVGILSPLRTACISNVAVLPSEFSNMVQGSTGS